ncbi:oligosaccharide flippase family protein [Mucilaginibacter sp. HMF5004]|uniref:lipopolysaccharide biosynthesis protein n=1 Tax=Mucilaginibacter rivuli TaxID=2857527 RepID=UPI001C5D3FE2|nr:oligosaccharide flippase family protein [Mucilaginibacter rivuli]MBW4890538.1 oligosaccharide flippase family protein [Mucilaginibacter rivuli]
MGIVKKQVYKNAFISYTGMVIGYVNLVILYPLFLSTQQLGLYVLLIGLSVIYSLIASMGVPATILRYFPFFRTEDRKHNGFVWWILGLSLIGFAASTLIYLVAKPLIVSYYIDQSPLFVQYFYLLIPLAGFTILYNLLEAFGKAIYQSVFSSFLKEIGLKLLTTIGIIAFAQKWISFEEFIILYICFNGVISICLLISLALSKRFYLGLSKVSFQSVKKRDVINYGLFTLMAGSVYVLLTKIDIVMLGAMVGLSVTGVYGFYANIAIVINVPAAALSRTTYQIVADAWRSNNLKSIADVYYKTSIIQLVIGSLLFIGVIINKQNLFAIIHKKEYIDQFNLFLVMGLTYLIDITGGLNTHIINTSTKYRMLTVVVALACIVCIGLTYLLIPVYGGMGAAFAYLITMAAFNFFNWFYIKRRFKMQPFTYKHLVVIVIAIASYFLGKYIWLMPNVYLDIVVRSSITTVFYTVLCYYLHVSDDLNEKVHTTLNKLGLGKR